VSVSGLGPRFRVALTLLNQGEAMLAQVPLLLEYDQALYATDKRHLLLPALLPSLEYRYSIMVGPWRAADCLMGWLLCMLLHPSAASPHVPGASDLDSRQATD
jgi:hypothetical protein